MLLLCRWRALRSLACLWSQCRLLCCRYCSTACAFLPYSYWFLLCKRYTASLFARLLFRLLCLHCYLIHLCPASDRRGVGVFPRQSRRDGLFIAAHSISRSTRIGCSNERTSQEAAVVLSHPCEFLVHSRVYVVQHGQSLNEPCPLLFDVSSACLSKLVCPSGLL